MRVKFLKAYKGHLKGTTYDASPNEAFGLIDSGVAIISKDMIPDDYKSKTLDEEQANAKLSMRSVRKKL